MEQLCPMILTPTKLYVFPTLNLHLQKAIVLVVQKGKVLSECLKLHCCIVFLHDPICFGTGPVKCKYSSSYATLSHQCSSFLRLSFTLFFKGLNLSTRFIFFKSKPINLSYNLRKHLQYCIPLHILKINYTFSLS